MCLIKYIRIRENSPASILQDIIEALNDRNLLYKIATNDYNSVMYINTARNQRNRVNKHINSAKATLENNRDNPKKFWRILNNSLLKGNHKSSDVTFDTGNENYTERVDSCEYMNNYIADIGVKLHEQFRNSSLGQEYPKIYNLECSDEEIVFTQDDILNAVNNIDVYKGSGIDYLPSFILKDVSW